MGSWENSVPSNQTWLNGGFNGKIIELNGGVFHCHFDDQKVISPEIGMQNHSYVSVVLLKMMIYTTQKITRVHSSYTLYTHICRYMSYHVLMYSKHHRTPSEALQIPSSSKLRTSWFHQIQRVCFTFSLKRFREIIRAQCGPGCEPSVSG